MDHGDHGGHGDHDRHAGHSVELFRNRFWVSLALTVPVLLYARMLWEWLGLEPPDLPAPKLAPFAIATAIFVYGGTVFLRSAAGEIRARQPGMMTLVAVGITAAWAYSTATTFWLEGEGFYWELATLVDVMLLGHWIEMRSITRASGALQELAKLLPDTAERIRDDRTEEVPVSELADDDLVLVRPGARVPADGEVIEGDSHLNQSMLTGESRPVKAGTGDQVVAGTVNEEGALRVRVTRTGEATALAGIMRLVEAAQASKSGAQAVADRVAGWLAYIAIGAGLITLAVWLAIGTEGASFVVERAVTVVVIACPHALGLAVPLVIAISTSLAARSGLLVRDRMALEAARRIDTVVFDKTGTLTIGEMGLVGLAVTAGREEDEALAVAAGAEADSEHALGRAIVRGAADRNVRPATAEAFEAVAGRGVRARIRGAEVHVGGPRLLESLNLSVPDELREAAATWSAEGKSVVYLVEDGKTSAALALADVIRPESREAVRALKDFGVRVAMITGDGEDVAGWVAGELGLDEVFAQVLPDQKASRIKELQDQGKRVAMVGDGVNDAPALAQADVGIAIGAGTDVAIETADVILIRSDPRDVVRVFELSRATYRKMVQNLVWGAGYNAFAIPLAAGVLAPIGIVLAPAVGALLMSASTVIVAFNAQLLRRDRRLRPAASPHPV
jgi:Cu2+-exporting ATPase